MTADVDRINALMAEQAAVWESMTPEQQALVSEARTIASDYAAALNDRPVPVARRRIECLCGDPFESTRAMADHLWMAHGHEVRPSRAPRRPLTEGILRAAPTVDSPSYRYLSGQIDRDEWERQMAAMVISSRPRPPRRFPAWMVGLAAGALTGSVLVVLYAVLVRLA